MLVEIRLSTFIDWQDFGTDGSYDLSSVSGHLFQENY